MSMENACNAKIKLPSIERKSTSSPSHVDCNGNRPQDLPPADFLSSSGSSSKKRKKSIVLDDVSKVLEDYKKSIPKVSLNTRYIEEQSRNNADQLDRIRVGLDQRTEEAVGRIRHAPPGVKCLEPQRIFSIFNLEMLPVFESRSLKQSDSLILSTLKCPSKAVEMCHALNLIKDLVTDKTLLLDNMFLAMCLHSQEKAIKSICSTLCKFIQTDFSRVYSDMSSWSVGYHTILSAFENFGVVDDITELFHDDTLDTDNIEHHSHIQLNIKYVLRFITCCCKYRNKFTSDDIINLITLLVKVALDKTVQKFGIDCDFQRCINSLLSIPHDNDDHPISFSKMEPVICQKLLSLVNFHHNKLKVVNLILPMDTRATNFRETLAYFAICQLLSAFDENDQLPSMDWSLPSLYLQFNKVPLTENTDQYLLYTLIQLFDIAVGADVESIERNTITYMRNDMVLAYQRMKESTTLPDVTVTKLLMHQVACRWSWLVTQVSDIYDVLDIKSIETPSKIAVIESSEVAADMDEEPAVVNNCDTKLTEADIRVSPDGPSPPHGSLTPSSSLGKGKRPMNPLKIPPAKNSRLCQEIEQSTVVKDRKGILQLSDVKDGQETDEFESFKYNTNVDKIAEPDLHGESLELPKSELCFEELNESDSTIEYPADMEIELDQSCSVINSGDESKDDLPDLD